MSSIKFHLYTPPDVRLATVTRFSGWCIGEEGAPAEELLLHVDGEPQCTLMPSFRADVGKAFPASPFAAVSGFAGDLVLPAEIQRGQSLTIEIVGRFSQREFCTLAKRNYVVSIEHSTDPRRSTSYNLRDLLEDPVAGEPGQSRGDVLMRESDRPPPLAVAGVPHFHDGVFPMIRLLDTGPTHPYGRLSYELIDQMPPAGIFLDLGCGIKTPGDLLPNAVLLDAVHFPGVDVVSTCRRLPFRDQIFDLVISQAVFEHLPDPTAMKDEIWRVLKPCGRVLIDTAFMQPLHGDPSHYNNMTLEALKLLMKKFEVLEAGIQPHQLPSFGLKMQIEAVLPVMRKGDWKAQLEQLLRDLTSRGSQLDDDLGPIGQRTLAAGVYIVGRKP